MAMLSVIRSKMKKVSNKLMRNWGISKKSTFAIRDLLDNYLWKEQFDLSQLDSARNDSGLKSQESNDLLIDAANDFIRSCPLFENQRETEVTSVTDTTSIFQQ